MTDIQEIKWNFSHYVDSHGRTYIISYYNQWDSQKKQSRIAKRVHVGRLAENTGRVTCGKKYLETHPELIGKELFYENKKLVERTPEMKDILADENQDFFIENQKFYDENRISTADAMQFHLV